jgi:mevalonate kinase
MSIRFVASAPGKVILSGEHSVVHGKLALATVLDKRSFAEFNVPGNLADSASITVVSSAGEKTFSWSLRDLQETWNAHPEVIGNYQGMKYFWNLDRELALTSK